MLLLSYRSPPSSRDTIYSWLTKTPESSLTSPGIQISGLPCVGNPAANEAAMSHYAVYIVNVVAALKGESGRKLNKPLIFSAV